MLAIYTDLASHCSPNGPQINMYPAGTFLSSWWEPSWGKDPIAHSWKGVMTIIIIIINCHRRGQWLATMAATPWFGGSNPSDDSELWNLSVCLSCVSLALFMRLKDSFQSLGSFCSLVNGPLTMTFSAFLVVIDIHRACCSEFAVTVMPAIYIDLASHWSPCGLHRNMYLAALWKILMRFAWDSHTTCIRNACDRIRTYSFTYFGSHTNRPYACGRSAVSHAESSRFACGIEPFRMRTRAVSHADSSRFACGLEPFRMRNRTVSHAEAESHSFRASEAVTGACVECFSGVVFYWVCCS